MPESSKEIGCLQAEGREQEGTFLIDICNNLGALQLSSEDPEENLSVFQKPFHSSAVVTLGHKSYKHQDWFDENGEEVQDLLDEEKQSLHKAHQDDTCPVSNTAAYNNISMTGAELGTCTIPG